MSVGSRGSLRVGKSYKLSVHVCVLKLLSSCTTESLFCTFSKFLQTSSFQGHAVFCARGMCFCTATFRPIIPSTQGTLWFLLTVEKREQSLWCIPFWLMLLTVLSQEELSQNFSLCSHLCPVSSLDWLSIWRIGGIKSHTEFSGGISRAAGASVYHC